MATAYGREEIMRQADKAGLEGFLIKPVNASVLFDTIIQVFGKEAAAPGEVAGRLKTEEKGGEHIVGARVLLVEDEPMILSMTKAMLERHGYSVISAVTPGEALRLAEAQAGEDLDDHGGQGERDHQAGAALAGLKR